MYRCVRTTVSNLTRRNKLMIYGKKLYDIVNKNILNNVDTEISFVLVKAPKYSFSRYWKLFTIDNNSILDITYEISDVLDLPMFGNHVIRTISYGVSIEDEICSRLTEILYQVYHKRIKIYHRFYDGTLED